MGREGKKPRVPLKMGGFGGDRVRCVFTRKYIGFMATGALILF